MPSESFILEQQAFCLKRTYEEHQLIAQRYRVEYERTQHRLQELKHPACSLVQPECVE